MSPPQGSTVTTEEVVQMFHHSAKRGPWPDEHTCEGIACWFSNLLKTGEPKTQIHAEPTSRKEEQLRRAAMKTLLAPLASVRIMLAKPGFFYDDQMVASLEEMERAINKAAPYLLGKPTPRVPPWAGMAIVIMSVAQDVLLECGRRSSGTNDNSVAAKFTSLALKRIGIGEPSPSAVANYYRRATNKLKRT
ncbi:MAG: hypothetical protein ACRYG8_13520 [Janthinobacterium lividum]